MENNKTFSLTLSPQVILGIILTALPIIGGGQQERIASLQDASIRMQEKSSDALASSREAQALAKGNTLEINSAITSMQEQMKALRKATTNPLGN